MNNILIILTLLVLLAIGISLYLIRRKSASCHDPSEPNAASSMMKKGKVLAKLTLPVRTARH